MQYIAVYSCARVRYRDRGLYSIFFRPSTFFLGTNRVLIDMITLLRHFRMYAYDKYPKNAIDACAGVTMDNNNNNNSK